MALSAKVGSFVKPTGAAPVSSVISGLGFQPKALILWTAARAASGIASHANLAIGLCAGGNAYSLAVAGQDNVNPSNTSSRMANKALTIVGYGELLLAEADLTSFDVDGFTLNWTTNNGLAYLINYLALGGSDLTHAKAVQWNTPAAEGTLAIGGVGFQPDACLHIGNASMPTGLPASIAGAAMGVGVMDKLGNQWAGHLKSWDAQTGGYTKGGSSDSYAFLADLSTGQGNAPEISAAFASMNADGFSLAFDQVNNGNARAAASLCLKGPRIRVGDFTKTAGAAPASQSVSGVGFPPKAVLLGSTFSPDGSFASAGERLAVGAADAVTDKGAAIRELFTGNGVNTQEGSWQSAANEVLMKQHSTADTALATGGVSSLDADGFSMLWSPNDAVATDLIGFLAIGDLNLAPYAPTLNVRDNFDATSAAQFTWTPNDPDNGDTQSAYQLLIKRVSDGVTVFDSGKVTAAVAAHTLAAGTLVNNVNYQWQVRTWDALDFVGPYSGLSTFSTSAKPAVAITDPAANGAVIAAASYAIDWTYNDPEAGAQSAYRVVLKEAGVTVSDSGKTPGTVTSYVITGLENGSSYSVEVTVWDAADIASDVAVRTFDVVYTPPPVPGIAVVGQDALGYIALAVTNPAPVGSQPTVAINYIYRRKLGEVSWTRIASDVANGGTYDDYAVSSGVTYEYKARAVGVENGATSDSATATEMVTLTGIWLHDVAAPASTARSYRARTTKRSFRRQRDVTLLRFEGRELPVAEVGEAREDMAEVSLHLLDGTSDLSALQALDERRAIVCYRDGRGRKLFGVIAELPEDDSLIGTVVDLRVEGVDYSEAV
jgi:hypothetical protein